MVQIVDDAPPGRASADTLSNNRDIPGGDAKNPIKLQSWDLGFIPIPKRLRWDPDKPVHFGLALNIVLGIAGTFIVTNLYYCQPILIQLADSFNASFDEVSRIPTLVQAGYAGGLLLISPLGDLVRRRSLLLVVVFISSTLTIGLALTQSLAAFEALSFLIGVFSVAPQILMPLAADLAPPEKRATAISIVMSGLLLGILIARVIAGIIAQFASWRVVYYMAIGVQYVVLVALWAVLPDYPAKNVGEGLTYWSILWSMAKLAVTEPVLIQACLINMASMACFTNFWVTLTFLLGEAPYNYSTLVIGLFGLVGMAGVLMSPILGRVIDRLVPWYASLVSTICLLGVQSINTGAVGLNVGAVIVVCLGLDVFRQMQQVSLTTSVYRISSNATARLNGVLLVAIFLGQIMGTAVGTKVFNEHGWRAAAGLSLAWTGLQLLILVVRGPHCKQYTWFGYEGGTAWRKESHIPVIEESIESKKENEGNKLGEKDSSDGVSHSRKTEMV